MPSDNAPHHKSSNVVIRVIIVAVVVMISGMIIRSVANRPEQVKLADYVVIKTSGYDGFGNAKACFDAKKFYREYKGKIRFTSSGRQLYKENYVSSNHYNDKFEDKNGNIALHTFRKSVKGDFNKFCQLSNGDRIFYGWSRNEIKNLEKYFNVKIDMTS